MKKRAIWIGILLSVIVIGYVLVTLDWNEVSRTLESVNWNWILLAFFVYLLNYVLRTIRFNLLLDVDAIGFSRLIGVTYLYGMYLYLMPAKFGEITFPVLVKNRLDIDISTSTGTLIAARVFDFLTIAILLPIALFVYWNIVPGNFKVASIIFSVIVFVAFGVFYWLLKNPDQVLPRLDRVSGSETFIQRVVSFVSGAYQGAQVIDQKRKYWRLLLVTLGIWLCINSNFFLITLGLGYDFNFFQIVVVSIILVPVELFPIQGFANLGAHELGWVTALTLFGLPYIDALNLAVSSHVIYIFFVLLLGGIGVVLLSTSQRPPQDKIS